MADDLHGDAFATGIWWDSDSLLKENIVSINNALNIINNLKPHSFNFKVNDYSYLNLDEGKQYGLVAQEVEKNIPELVKEMVVPEKRDTLGNVIREEQRFKALNYNGFIPILIQGVKELDSITTKLSSPPDVPMLVQPLNGDTLGDSLHPVINLIWNTSKGAVAYHVEVSRNSLFTNTESATTLLDTVYNALQFGDTCNVYWRVYSMNSYGKSPYSETRYYLNISPKIIPKDTTIQSIPADTARLRESTLSDSTLKTDVSILNNALSLIAQMQAVKFYWDTINHTWLPASEQIGLIGQQINNIVPQVVFKDSAGYYNIQYGRLVALLVEGMKEQQLQIDSLKTIVMGTNNKSTGDNGNNDIQSKMQYVELVTENAIILNQNDPNPFAEETDITYYLPDDVSQAKIMFYDNNGKIIKTVELIGRGNGTLHVYASNLSSGIYAYALVADGKVIDTKKMVCSKK